MSALSFLPSVRHLIFDLGGVLYRLNFGAVERELSRLQRTHRNGDVPSYSRHHQSELFLQYERGELSSEEFRETLRSTLQLTASDTEIDHAWCSMLVGLYEGRIDMLKELRRFYSIILLSNTNDIHLRYVANQYPQFFSLFDQCFFSHELGMRKPDIAIFQYVMSAMNILPEDSLFIEDSPQHIEGAQQVGIHTFWVHHPSSVVLLQHMLQQSLPIPIV